MVKNMKKTGRKPLSYKEVFKNPRYLEILALLRLTDENSKQKISFQELKYVFCKDHGNMTKKHEENSIINLKKAGYRFIKDKRDNHEMTELEYDLLQNYEENKKIFGNDFEQVFTKKDMFFPSIQALSNALYRIGDKGLKVITKDKDGFYYMTDHGLFEFYKHDITFSIDFLTKRPNINYKLINKKLKDIRVFIYKELT